MTEINIPYAIDHLRPGAQYLRCETYQALVETWADPTPVPTLDELQVAYDEYLVEKAEKEALVAPLDINDYTNSPAIIKALAQKVIWLQSELVSLKGV